MTTEAAATDPNAAPPAAPVAAPPPIDPPVAPSAPPAAPAATPPAAPAPTDPNAKSEDDATKIGAPEAYEDFTTPEGGALDPKVAETFKAAAKELNLPQDQAQALVTKLQPALAAHAAETLAAAQTEWATAAKSDKEIGGDAFEANLAVARTTFEKFGTPELKTFLAESGLGNHPELIRWAHRVGKAMSDDTFVPPSKPAARGGDMADRLYGSTPAQQAA